MRILPPTPTVRRLRRWLVALGLLFLVGYLATSENIHIWPIRNTLIYRLDHWWAARFGVAQPGVGALAGCVRDQEGRGLAAARVLVSESDGLVRQAGADDQGCYRLDGLPEGHYVPLFSAAGYAEAAGEPWGLPVPVRGGEVQRIDAVLAPALARPFAPPTSLAIGEPVGVTSDLPAPSAAIRRRLQIESADGSNQPTYLYAPLAADTRLGGAPLPTLLAVYPGPADEWEGVSIPLAAAGYAVVAVGPEYSLDLEADLDELKRLLGLIRGGALPGVDGGRVAVMGGSYSSLHVQRLLEDEAGLRGAVLLGPISDLFDLRRRFEAGTFAPPFGLDEALIALGQPSTAAQRYSAYSALYHVRADMPPLLLLHSRADEIVPAEQSERLIAEYERLGVPVEAHFFDGMSHYLRTDQPSADLDALYAITLEFLGRQLGR